MLAPSAYYCKTNRIHINVSVYTRINKFTLRNENFLSLEFSQESTSILHIITTQFVDFSSAYYNQANGIVSP